MGGKYAWSRIIKGLDRKDRSEMTVQQVDCIVFGSGRSWSEITNVSVASLVDNRRMMN